VTAALQTDLATTDFDFVGATGNGNLRHRRRRVGDVTEGGHVVGGGGGGATVSRDARIAQEDVAVFAARQRAHLRPHARTHAHRI